MPSFMQVINKAIKAVQNAPKYVQNLSLALKDFFTGAFWYGLPRSLNSGWVGTSQIAVGTYQIGAMIGKYIVIFFIFLYNLPFCIIPHFIVLLFYLAYYLFLVAPIYLIKYATGLDLMPNLHLFIRVLRQGNSMVFDITGISLLDFPAEINGKCYTYFGKPLTVDMIYDDLNVFTRVGDDFNYTFNVQIPNLMRLPTNLMRSARIKFKKISG